MTPQTPRVEDLEQIRDQLRAEIREARETLADLRREIKDAKVLVPLLTDELFEAEVRKHVDQLSDATKLAMDQATTRVMASFERLQATLMGEDRHSRRKGRPSIPELLDARKQQMGGATTP
jgi:hypothetical protein